MDSRIESAPFLWKDSLYVLIADRDKNENRFLSIYTFKDKRKIASFGDNLQFASVFVNSDGMINIFGTKDPLVYGGSTIQLIKTADLTHFTSSTVVLRANNNQRFFNTSVTQGPNKLYIMTVEVDEKEVKSPFSARFYTSSNLDNWIPSNDFLFAKEVYLGCPTLRYFDSFYYLWYLVEDRVDPNCKVGVNGDNNNCKLYKVQLSRSKDLLNWQTSAKDFLYPGYNEGINSSDIDFAEYNGETYIFYATGDQKSWGDIQYFLISSPLREVVKTFFE
jgi:hypothetical protein